MPRNTNAPPHLTCVKRMDESPEVRTNLAITPLKEKKIAPSKVRISPL
jgi:hypothetical protein